MTSFPRPMCFSCARFDEARPGMYCTAFPEGIPDEITESRWDHRVPMAGEETFVQREDRVEPDWEAIAASPTTEDQMSTEPVTAAALRDRVRPSATAVALRARVHPQPVVATATSALNTDKRKKAAAKGQALPDGSYPIIDKKDWYKAKQALGRAKNRARVVKHLISRAKTLGIPAKDYKGLTASSNAGIVAALTAAYPSGLGRAMWDELLHPRGRDGKWIDKGGFVNGLFTWDIDSSERKPQGVKANRAEVVGFGVNKDDPDDPFIIIENKLGNRGYAKASTVTQVAGPKGSLMDEPPSPQPGPGQLSTDDIVDLPLTPEGDVDYMAMIDNAEVVNNAGRTEAEHRTRRAAEIGIAVDEYGVPFTPEDQARLAEHLQTPEPVEPAYTSYLTPELQQVAKQQLGWDSQTGWDPDVINGPEYKAEREAYYAKIRKPRDPAGYVSNPDGLTLTPEREAELLELAKNANMDRDTWAMRKVQAGDHVEGAYMGHPMSGTVKSIRPHTQNQKVVVVQVDPLDQPLDMGGGDLRDGVMLEIGYDGYDEPSYSTNGSFLKKVDEGPSLTLGADVVVDDEDAFNSLRQQYIDRPGGSINESMRSADITEGEREGALEAEGDPAVWIKEKLMPLYSPYASDSTRNIGRKHSLEALAEAAGWRKVDTTRTGAGTYGLAKWIPPGSDVPSGMYIERGSGLADARSHYLGGAEKFPNWNNMAGEWLAGTDRYFNLDERAAEWDITPDELRGILTEMSGQGAADEGRLFSPIDDVLEGDRPAGDIYNSGQWDPNAKGTWLNDMAKLQNALENGGWITSTPDETAPGGVFTYIDPEAPPELVALYQKLISMGYANGWV